MVEIAINPASAFAKAALSQLSYIPVAVLIVAIMGRYVNDYASGMSD